MIHFPSPLIILVLGITGFGAALPKHWHESGGFATDMEAGLGGRVYKVTNLKNSGPGSLMEAVEASGDRLVVFEVGGVINLEGQNLDIRNGNITIAGQTAPYPGITLIRGSLVASGNDIVVSHIASRLGTEVPKESDASDITGTNIVFDHVNISWSIDECLSITGASNVTLYKTMVTEALSNATHKEGEHSKGSLIQRGTDNTSLIGTFYAHNALRNPRLHSGAEISVINGVIYDWFPGADDEGDKRFNMVIHLASAKISVVGVTAIQGPASVGEELVSGHKGGNATAYMKDNIIIDPSGRPLKEHHENVTPLESPVSWPTGVEVLPPEESLYEVLRTVGPRPGDRDPVTLRTVKSAADGTGGIVNTQDDVGGYPDFPPTQRTLAVPDGFAARRAWLDSLEDEIAVDKTMDLSRLYPLVGSMASDKFRAGGSSIGRSPSYGSEFNVSHRLSNRRQLRSYIALATGNSLEMTVFDYMGCAVARHPWKSFPAGDQELVTDVRHLESGVYLCRIRIGRNTRNQRIFLP